MFFDQIKDSNQQACMIIPYNYALNLHAHLNNPMEAELLF